MAQAYTLTVQFPALVPPGDDDVVTRRVSVSTDGAAPVVTDYPAAAAEFVRTVSEDSVLTITLTHLDDNGNESAPSTLTLTVYDTTPPAAPGAMTYTLVPAPVVPPPPPPPGRRILEQTDLTPAGLYPAEGGDANYGGGLTHRWVDGQLRLLTLTFRGNTEVPRLALIEYAVPPSPGELTRTNTWNDIWGDGTAFTDTHHALWFEQSANRLWHSGAFDYPQAGFPTTATNALSVRTLDPGGSVSNFAGYFGLPGVGQRALTGGIKPIPAWFAAAHCPGMPYLLGHGGYTSLMNQGLGASIGPFLAVAGDPSADAGLPWDSSTPTMNPAEFKIAADFRGDYRPGQLTPVENYLDGGDPRPNPPTRPTDPPDTSTGSWIGQRPDGKYWASWFFKLRNSLNWVDDDAGTRPAHGILTIAEVAGGKAWYQESSGHTDRLVAEVMVYDPDVIAAALTSGSAVRPEPTRHWVLPLPGWGGHGNTGHLSGATFVPEQNRIYVLATWYYPEPAGTPVRTMVYAFDVN